jgi:hypothetical protein
MTRHLLTGALFAVMAFEPAMADGFRSPPLADDQPCLQQGSVYNYQLVPGNQSLVVTDLGRRRYRLTFAGKCYDLDYQFGLRFKTSGVGRLSCVARGDSVLLHDTGGPGQCVVRNIQYQTPEMDKADREAGQQAAAQPSR